MRRYYRLVVEVDDTPEVDLSGNATQPGVPVVTSCRRLGFISRMLHVFFGKRRNGAYMCTDEVVMEIPGSVDTQELFDYLPGGGFSCKIRKQQQVIDDEIP